MNPHKILYQDETRIGDYHIVRIIDETDVHDIVGNALDEDTADFLVEFMNECPVNTHYTYYWTKDANEINA